MNELLLSWWMAEEWNIFKMGYKSNEKDIDLWSMEVGALISHSAGKKHKKKSDKFKSPGIESFFVHKIFKSTQSFSSSSAIGNSSTTFRTLDRKLRYPWKCNLSWDTFYKL